jgi:hypothetical protein
VAVTSPKDGDVNHRIEARLAQRQCSVDRPGAAGFGGPGAVDEPRIVVEALAARVAQELQVVVEPFVGRGRGQLVAQRSAELDDPHPHAADRADDGTRRVKALADVQGDVGQLLRFAERFPAADHRLLGCHRHQQRIEALGIAMAGGDGKSAGAERGPTLRPGRRGRC